MLNFMETALINAIIACGGSKKLAAALGISHQAISQWTQRGECPVRRVLDVERASGVSRYELRPDIYPPPQFIRPREHARTSLR
jgi:DNA-binding transcriptional regulator YdaS (Cro superfamily)